jgi:outer membrane protein TolC
MDDPHVQPPAPATPPTPPETSPPAGMPPRAAELEEALAALREELHRAHTARREAVHRYRAALLAQSPELPAELVTGETVEEVEATVQRARELVARVRDQLATDTGRAAPPAEAAVPAGSPPRRPPDLDALSPTEKIRLGLSRR